MTARDGSTSGTRRNDRSTTACRSTTARRSRQGSRRIGPLPLWALLAIVVAIVAVVGIAAANSLADGGSGERIRYDVGRPGVGEAAPDFELASATGGSFRLSDQRGKRVLLYFHEGLMCAPCWKQLEDIQADLDRFSGLGVDEIVGISVDPLPAQQQRAQVRGIRLRALVDGDRSVSAAYDALSFGMMGGSLPGHTFILIGPDGAITWRADYGGPPDYRMYVPNDVLLAELGDVLGPG